MHNITTAKEPKNAQLIPSKKSVKVSFVTSGMVKIGKMVEDFLFLPFIHFILTNILMLSAVQCSAVYCIAA